jgi:hypothetical protein
MRNCRDEPQNQTKAMEQWWRAADNVFRIESYPIPDKPAVVDNIPTFCEHFSILNAYKKATYLCVSIAALGFPVVPLVY